ncbi:non-receptor serine/threonine protein kinase [Lithospermum erythrorhizon]|uniref:Non-receptor serine/threonine protein kinase n=1 Tax=Lithospermum erythrorhizon TaxID=34254 RepID=A0AAV3PYI9_LITER
MTGEPDKIGSDTSGVTDDNEDDDFADLDNTMEEIDDMERNRRPENTLSSAARAKKRRLVEEERRLVDEDSDEGEEHPPIWNLTEPANVDGDGTLNYGEFVVVSVHLRKMANDEHLHKALAFFDRNQNGYIEVDELRDALSDEGE